MSTSRGRGLKLSDLAPHLRAQVQLQIDNDARRRARDNRARLLAQAYVVGSLELWAPGDPPTVTHQAKHIAIRNGKPTLRDDERLVAARQHYARCFGHNPDTAKLAGPIEATIQVRFRQAEGPPTWWEKKPDADNSAKAVLDAVEAGGFLQDEKVSLLIVQKLGINHTDPRKNDGPLGLGVLVRLRTLERSPTILAPGPNLGRIVPKE